MFLQKQYEIKINAANYRHFSKWYQDLKCGQTILCAIDKLLENSRVRIDVKCDSCGVEKSIEYRDYNKHNWTNGDYLCKKCKLNKFFGVKNVFELENVKQKIKSTLLEKYEVDNISKLESIKEKKKKTTQNNFQVDYPQQSEIVRQKTINTVKAKWNVENISNLDEIKKKKIKTHRDKTGYDFVFNSPDFISSQIQSNLTKYGVTYSFCADEIKSKITQTNLIKWGNKIASKNDTVKTKIKKNVTHTLNKKTFNTIKGLISIDSEKRFFEINCENCDKEYQISWALFYKRRETKTITCTNCNPVDKHQSGLEIDFYNFIRSIYSEEIKQNSKIDSKELDIYLPKIKLAFEFNGLYWHSELFKERAYHLDKVNICRKHDITLMHIWEDDWIYNRSIIESIIKNKIGITQEKIYARKCDIKLITEKKIAHDFLNHNHIQGGTIFSIGVGLFYEQELVAVMTFIKRKSSWELNRFCNRLNCLVIGGASRLLSYFTKSYSRDIFTFSDNCYSSGNLYRTLGFSEDYHLKPDYSIFDSGIRRHKFNYRNFQINDLVKIWDAGKIKFRLS